MSAPIADGTPQPRRTLGVVGLCFFIAMLEGYDIQAFGVGAPQMVADLGIDAAQQGLAASAAMAGLVMGAVLGGWLSERVGRRNVLVASVLLFGLGSIWTGFVDSYAPLLTARIVTGLGFGGALPLLIAIAAEISPPDRRALTTSAMFCGMPIGGALVSLFAGVFDQPGAWRTVFLIGGILPVLISVAVMRFLPETRPVDTGEATPKLPSVLFGGNRLVSTGLLWVANFLTLIVLYLMLNWLPSLVVASGQAPSVGATAALCFNLAGAAGAILLGLTVDRFGFRGPYLVAYGALAVVMLMLAAADVVPAILLLSAAAGFMTMGTQYALYGHAPVLYPGRMRAIGAGAAVAVGRLGSIVGPILAGGWRQDGWSPSQVLQTLVPFVLVAGAAAFLLALRTPRDKA